MINVGERLLKTIHNQNILEVTAEIVIINGLPTLNFDVSRSRCIFSSKNIKAGVQWFLKDIDQ